ncbi:hypothetical protein PENSPDRAFT_694462 [Peniophora sp. CONT]|nr:hypothetical protein PENSPDRAFT_694462 [Peniophora sp. CONT]
MGGPTPDITPAHDAHLRRFEFKIRNIEKLPEQTSSGTKLLKTNFFANSTRSLVVAFGWPDTLKNKVPEEGSDWDYEHIPQLPDIADKDEHAKRADYIKKLTVKVRKHYTKIKNGGGGGGGSGGSARAALSQAQIDRAVKAMQPPPLRVRPLDVYQSRHADRWQGQFKAEWEVRVAGADDAERARLEKDRAGAQRRFAAKCWQTEPDSFCNKVQKECDVAHENAKAAYAALWGAPDNVVRTSRAWAEPEMGAFFQALLQWAATRYGVATTLLVSGKVDDGQTNCFAIHATGDTLPGSVDLKSFIAHDLALPRAKMTAFARDCLIGDALTMSDAEEGEDDLGAKEEGAAEEDFTQAIENVIAVALAHQVYVAQEFPFFATNTQIPISAFPPALAFPSNSEPASQPFNVPRASSRPRTRPQPSCFTPDDIANWLTIAPSPRALSITGALEVASPSGGRRSASRSRSRGRAQRVGRSPNAPSRHAALGAFGRAATGDKDSLASPFQRGRRRSRTPDAIAAGPKPGAPRSPSLIRPKASYAIRGKGATAQAQTSGGDDFDDDLGFSNFESNFGGGDPWRPKPNSKTGASDGGQSQLSRSVSRSLPSEGESDDEAMSVEALHLNMFSDRRQRVKRKKKLDDRRAMITDGLQADDDGGDASSTAGPVKKRRRATTKTAAGTQKKAGTKSKPVEKIPGADALEVGRSSRSRVREREDSIERDATHAPRPQKKRRAAVMSDEEDEDTEWAVPLPELQPAASAAAAKDGDRERASPSAAVEGERVDARAEDEGVDTSAQGVGIGSGPRRVEEDGGEPVALRQDGWLEAWKADHSGTANGKNMKDTWKRYGKKRTVIVGAIDQLTVSENRAYANLVDAAEILLKSDDVWDSKGTPSLPMEGRPGAVGTITRGRGVKLTATQVSENWGRDMVRWWLTMQPAQRRKNGGTGFGSLSAPDGSMEWTPLASTRGYKGPFLLVWCMMHWILYDNDRTNFAAVANDMAAVFNILHTFSPAQAQHPQVTHPNNQGQPLQGQANKPASEMGRGARVKKPTEKKAAEGGGKAGPST